MKIAGQNIPWTYSGMLDDVVNRYGITPEVNREFFNLSILRNILFSGPILLNDGYMFHHPIGLEQAQDPRSLIRQMVSHNFVRILSRGSDPESFASQPEILAKRGVNTSIELIARPDWPEIRGRFLSWAQHLYEDERVSPWPKMLVHEGFKKLFGRIFNKETGDLGLVGLSSGLFDEFALRYHNHPDMGTAPRSAVEHAVLSLQTEGVIGRDTVIRLMDIANQCYHYNFGMLLSDDMKTTVVSDTTIGKAFEDILDMDQSFEAELENMPTISIPRGFPIDKPHMYEAFFMPGSNLRLAKQNFMTEIDSAMKSKSNRSSEARADEIKRATNEYKAVLADHFKDFVSFDDLGPRRNAMITLAWNSAKGLAAGADNIVLLADIVSPGQSASFVQRMTEPLNRRIVDVGLSPDAGEEKLWTYRVADVRPRFSSVAFNSKAVAAHVEGLPRSS